MHTMQQWFDSYKGKHSNDTDNMLSRMFWGVLPEKTIELVALQRKLLYAKLVVLAVVCVAGFWGMWSLCRDSPFSMLAAYKDDQAKQAESDDKKATSTFNRGERGKL